MRNLIKAPIYLALIMFFMMMLLSSAQAWEIEKIGIEGKVQEMQRIEWVQNNGHLTVRESQTLRAIDGNIPAIEISMAKTGMPEEFIEIPKKHNEQYTGN